jgi:hypothetical protein
LVYFHPEDIKKFGNPKYIDVKGIINNIIIGMVYKTSSDDRIKKGYLGLNRLQRNNSRVNEDDKVKVIEYNVPKQNFLSTTIEFEVNFANPKSYQNEEIVDAKVNNKI